MKIRFNSQLFLWALGVIQPASTEEILLFVRSIFTDIGDLQADEGLQLQVNHLVKEERIVRVEARSRLYCLTSRGNHAMPTALRRARDKARLFLLKDAYLDRLLPSGDAPGRLDGVPPSGTGSSDTQEARPISSAVAPRIARTNGRIYWPRVTKQLQVGSSSRSPDVFLRLYSFASIRSLHASSDDPAAGKDMSIVDLALAIGVSPRLLTSFIHKPKNHYREFQIGKRGGGTRVIHAPRLFLKVVQYWLRDYLLARLPQHHASHGYRRGRSIVTNAQMHVGMNFVANVDIQDFFPSVSCRAITAFLERTGFGRRLASTVARLCTLEDGLPQGAPTSPLLSNAFLYDLDEELETFCRARHVAYTRYADDITFSSNARSAVVVAVDQLRQRLSDKGLRLNENKTRIASRGSQQKVTGVVVNEKAQPPRKFRRRLRAMFHQASLSSEPSSDVLKELAGYLSYLKSFPSLRNSRELEQFENVLSERRRSSPG